MGRILRALRRRLRLGSLERGDFADSSYRPVENLDAGTAAMDRDDDAYSGQSTGANYPPGYVKPQDEGRPRH